jgi:hydroxymethylglutaryl-CoA reductase
MALHARCVAVEAGARGEQVDRVVEMLVKSGEVKVEKARQVLEELRKTEAATRERLG